MKKETGKLHWVEHVRTLLVNDEKLKDQRNVANSFSNLFITGHAVTQLVEALRYKSEGHGFDSWWCHWNFSLTSFRPHYGPGVDSASNRNEYQEYFLGVKAAGA